MAQPNIILITADGLRWDGMGCAGDPNILTPNIDALAAHGLRFSNVLSPFPRHPGGGHAFLTGDAPSDFDPHTPNAGTPSAVLRLPDSLREVGYSTAAVGALDFDDAARARAFDQIFATGCPNLEDSYATWLATEGVDTSRATTVPSSRRARPSGETHHPTTWTGNRAVRTCQTASEPFFLWVSFPRPRPPFDPPAPWSRMYQRATLRPASGAPEGEMPQGPKGKTLAAYYGCISQLDRQVGRILATLTARGRTNNLFILTAGYGLPTYHPEMAGLGSTLLPEALLRVPLIVAGHVTQRKGAVEPALASLGDLVPTLWDMLQLSGAPPTGGRSLYRQCVEPGIPHRPAVVSVGAHGVSSLRTPRYKWVATGTGEGDGLFDLQADPRELHNLEAAQQSLAIRKMLMGVSQRDARPAR